MGSGARRRRACFGPGTWNSPRHAETDDDGENLDAEMADGAAEENSPRQAETDDDGENLDAEMADGAAEETLLIDPTLHTPARALNEEPRSPAYAVQLAKTLPGRRFDPDRPR
ncbi:hypothetical protein PR003_g30974, partial [Phytophthora rubi]